MMTGARIEMAFVLLVLALFECVLSANVVHMGLSRSTLDINATARDFKSNSFKRASVVSDIYNNYTNSAAYMISVSVGTPGQAISLVIDTGSSDTFMLSDADIECSDRNSSPRYEQCVGGTFDPSLSSTYVKISSGGFKIRYVDQSQSYGDYISDNFEIGGSLVSALQMGLAIDSTVGVGIMGIGYQTGESVTAVNRYPNLIDQMVAQKLINLRAYSLYLDDKETAQGSILFGGIDTERFIGDLKVVSIQENPRTKAIDSFIVELTSISIIQDTKAIPLVLGSTSVPVMLDSGTTLTFLPASIFNTTIQSIGAIDDSNNSGFVYIDCDLRISRPDEFISYGFGDINHGPVINVPLRELILDIDFVNHTSPFTSTCDFGIRTADFSVFILGDTFLRSAYVVYDIDHNQIALAQTNFEASGSNILEIPSDSVSIPLLSGQAVSSSSKSLQSAFYTSFATSSSGIQILTLTGKGIVNTSSPATMASNSLFPLLTAVTQTTSSTTSPANIHSNTATTTPSPAGVASGISSKPLPTFLKDGSLDIYIISILLLLGGAFLFINL